MPRAGFFASAHVPAAAPSAGLQYVGSGNRTSAGTLTASFDLGAAAADRFVLVGLTSQTTTNGTATISVGGNSIPELEYLNNRDRIWLHGALVPSGSGLVSISGTPSGGVSRMFVWVARGLEPSGESITGASGSYPLVLTTEAGDSVVALSMSWQSGSGQTPAWSANLTHRGVEYGAGSQPGAAADGVATGASFSARADWVSGSTLLLLGMRAA